MSLNFHFSFQQVLVRISTVLKNSLAKNGESSFPSHDYILPLDTTHIVFPYRIGPLCTPSILYPNLIFHQHHVIVFGNNNLQRGFYC
jgi:hypothetical protein